MSLMHVEQEIVGSEETVLQHVLKSYLEREYLLDLEKQFIEDSEKDMVHITRKKCLLQFTHLLEVQIHYKFSLHVHETRKNLQGADHKVGKHVSMK